MIAHCPKTGALTEYRIVNGEIVSLGPPRIRRCDKSFLGKPIEWMPNEDCIYPLLGASCDVACDMDVGGLPCSEPECECDIMQVNDDTFVLTHIDGRRLFVGIVFKLKNGDCLECRRIRGKTAVLLNGIRIA